MRLTTCGSAFHCLARGAAKSKLFEKEKLIHGDDIFRLFDRRFVCLLVGFTFQLLAACVRLVSSAT